MSTPADKVAAAFQKAAGTIAKNLFAGRYEILRAAKPADEFGGRTGSWTVVESGRCNLESANLRGVDRNAANIGIAIGSYSAELWPDPVVGAPRFSIVKATDRIRITVANRANEIREFEIVGSPLKGDDMEMFVKVQLEVPR